VVLPSRRTERVTQVVGNNARRSGAVILHRLAPRAEYRVSEETNSAACHGRQMWGFRAEAQTVYARGNALVDNPE